MSLSPQEKLIALETMMKMLGICPRCGHEMFKTIYDWWECEKEGCVQVKSHKPHNENSWYKG